MNSYLVKDNIQVILGMKDNGVMENLMVRVKWNGRMMKKSMKVNFLLVNLVVKVLKQSQMENKFQVIGQAVNSFKENHLKVR